MLIARANRLPSSITLLHRICPCLIEGYPQNAPATLLSERKKIDLCTFSLDACPLSGIEALLAAVGPLSAPPVAAHGLAGCDPVRHHLCAGSHTAGGELLHRSGHLRRDLHGLVVLALLTIVLALAGQGLAVAETYVAENVSWAATNELRADLLTHLLRLDATFHTAHTPGKLIERVDGDVGTLARFFSRFVVYVLGNGLLLLGVLGLLYHVDWRVGLAMSAFVVLALAAVLRIRAVAIPSWAAERQASADFYGFLGEYLAGMEDIRSTGLARLCCAAALR